MSVKGIASPFKKGLTGFPETVEDDELIQQSLENILLTPVGARVMRPQFGCNAMLYVHGSNTVVLSAKIKQETMRAIRANEPRVRIASLDIEVQDTKVIVNVGYIVNRKAGMATVELPRGSA